MKRLKIKSYKFLFVIQNTLFLNTKILYYINICPIKFNDNCDLYIAKSYLNLFETKLNLTNLEKQKIEQLKIQMIKT